MNSCGSVARRRCNNSPSFSTRSRNCSNDADSRGGSSIAERQRPSGPPAVVLAHLDHRRENVVPRFLLRHDRVWEHAAVPANMLELLRDLAAVIAHPVTGIARNVQLAVRIIDAAMTARLIVRAGAMDRGVVLRDMEIKGPRAQCLGHFLHR